MCGCSQGGHAWLLAGGACMVAPGGMHGCSGACVVAPRGACMVARRGGMHGCSRGGVCGCSGGHAWFFSMRYGQ